jgi:SNF2 family DNA or RNA helicase
MAGRFKNIPGRKFHGDAKEWSFPLVRDVLHMVCDCIGVLPHALPPEAAKECGPGPECVNKVALDETLLNNWKFLTEPYKHQRKNLVRLLQWKRWLLADEMGTGKSWAAIMRLACWVLHHGIAKQHHNKKLDNALIVCPTSCVEGWRRQLRQHGGHDAYVIGEDKGYPDTNIFVCGYGYLTYHADKVFTEWLNIYGGSWKFLVVDEIHRCKSFTSKTSKICRKLSEQADYVYGLSGTPAPNGLEDWFGVLSVIDPTLLPVTTKTGFEERYCVKERLGEGGPRIIKGYRNVHELHNYIAQVTSRVTKAECLDLPPKVVEPRYVRLEGEQKRVYASIKKDAVAKIKTLKAEGTLTVQNILTESLRLVQIAGGFVPDDDGVLHRITDADHPLPQKVAVLDEVLDELGDKQCVIWCSFKEEVRFLAEYLATRGVVVTMTGESSQGARVEAVDSFHRGDARLFISTTPTGGTGINGLEVADTEVYYGRGFNLCDWLQSQDRLHRIGQTRKVTVIPLIAEGTIDVAINDALDRKADMQEMMMADPEKLF